MLYKDKEKSVTDQRRYSLIDPSSESEVIRLQHRLVSTEDVLRNALEQGHQMEKLMEAMRLSSEKTQVERQQLCRASAIVSPVAQASAAVSLEQSPGILPCAVGVMQSALSLSLCWKQPDKALFCQM